MNTRDRVNLTIKAIASKDIAEAKRLMDTCPKEQVEVTNLEFLNTTRMLLRVAILYESDLRGIALTMAGNMSNAGASVLTQGLEQFAAAKVAWDRFCESQGVSPHDLAATTGGHHPTVEGFLNVGGEANPDLVGQWLKAFATAASGEVLGDTRH